MLSYQMVKDTIDGKKTIIQNPTEKQRQEHENVSYKTASFDSYLWCFSVNLPSMKSMLLICSSLLVMVNHVIWISVQPFIRENQTRSINSK